MSFAGVVCPLFKTITLSSVVTVAVLSVVVVPFTVKLPLIIALPVISKSVLAAMISDAVTLPVTVIPTEDVSNFNKPL